MTTDTDLKREMTEIDSKLRELEVETGDHALDTAQRIKSLREHIADVQDQLRDKDSAQMNK